MPDERYKVCLHCSEQFERNPKFSQKQWDGVRFCSRGCSTRWQAIHRPRPKRPCPDCGLRMILLATPRCNTCDNRIKNREDPARRELNAATKERFKANRPGYWKQPHLRERARLNSAQRRLDKPDEVRAAVRAGKTIRRARERGVESDPSVVLKPWLEILRRDPCSYCGKAAGTVDHVVAIARGGGNVVENLVGCCPACNSAKRSETLLDFMLWRR